MTNDRDRAERGRVIQADLLAAPPRLSTPNDLNRAMDLLNDGFREVERRLQFYGIKGKVLLEYNSSPRELGDADISPWLVFEKHGSEWLLLLSLEVENERIEAIPLRSCPRAVRLAAARALPALIRVVEQNISREAAQIEEALIILGDALTALPHSPDSAEIATPSTRRRGLK